MTCRILPISVRRMLRRVLSGVSLSVSHKVLTEWPDINDQSDWAKPEVVARFRRELETASDMNVIKQSPIVLDNLIALSRTGLPEATLLDFGCGNGIYKLILASFPQTARWRYVGADNAELVKLCRTMHPGTRFEPMKEGSRIPFPDKEFDIVMASGVLQYVKDYVAILSEFRRITNNYVLISRLPVCKHTCPQVVLQTVFHTDGVERHVAHVFNREMLEACFRSTGFSMVWRDYGSEFFHIPGIDEPVVHNLYLLQKEGAA